MALKLLEPCGEGRLSDRDWQVSNTTSTLPVLTATLSGASPGRKTFRLPFDQRELIVEIEGDPPGWVEPTVRSLGKLLRLGPDWDSYGGRPVEAKCVVAALELACTVFRRDTPAPAVVPTSRGGVQFEWHTRGADLELEFLSPTRIAGFFEDQVSGLLWEKDLTSDWRPLIEAISAMSQRH